MFEGCTGITSSSIAVSSVGTYGLAYMFSGAGVKKVTLTNYTDNITKEKFLYWLPPSTAGVLEYKGATTPGDDQTIPKLWVVSA